MSCCLLLPALAAAAPASPSAAPAAAPIAAPAAIHKLLDDQVAAWNKHDLEGYMAGYWKSPKLTFYSGGAVTTGWDETLARYRKRYQGEGKQMDTLAFSDLSIEVLGPKIAWARGAWQLTPAAGRPLKGLFTLLLRKTTDGWRIIHDHSSLGD